MSSYPFPSPVGGGVPDTHVDDSCASNRVETVDNMACASNRVFVNGDMPTQFEVPHSKVHTITENLCDWSSIRERLSDVTR